MNQSQEILSPIGIIIITHERIGQSLLDTVTHIVGKQIAIEVINIDNDKSKKHQDYILLIREKISSVNLGRGVILLTDMFGGTPSNLALVASSCKEVPVEVIAGVNLPLLLKLVEIRNKLSLFEAAQVAQESGRKYICIASDLLKV